MQTSKPSPAGRPRLDLNATVFATTLQLVDELGYAKATCERVAERAGVAKTTIYRRWPTKGDLIVDTLLDAFGPPPLDGTTRHEILESAIRWAAHKIGQPGTGAAFAGVFSDAVSDPDLRQILSTRFQEPYKIALQEALGEPEHQVLFFIDVVSGSLLHRLGMTGEPMVEADVTALARILLRELN